MSWIIPALKSFLTLSDTRIVTIGIWTGELNYQFISLSPIRWDSMVYDGDDLLHRKEVTTEQLKQTIAIMDQIRLVQVQLGNEREKIIYRDPELTNLNDLERL